METPCQRTEQHNVKRLAHYTTTMVEDENTMGSTENKYISENCNKNIDEWSSYNGGHLVYSGAAMAEGN